MNSIRAWGRAEPVRIFKRRQSKPDGERDPLVEPLEHALAAYRRQAFEVVEAGFGLCLEIDPEDGASAVPLERLVALREAPPDIDWDGVWTLTKYAQEQRAKNP